MKKILFALVVLCGLVACEKKWMEPVPDSSFTESFEKTISGDYSYGYVGDDLRFEYFYNDEFNYWGGFAQSKMYDTDLANGLFENQYSVYNSKAKSGDNFLLYYYDSYSEPCDIVFKREGIRLQSLYLNLTTYTYASITNEDINSFARVFGDGDYLKVVFTPLLDAETVVADKAVECYVVDYRDGKRKADIDWTKYDLLFDAEYYGVRVTIETTDVGDYGANTPLYIAMDDLFYTVE